MRARIFKQAKNAMQSGRANTHDWILEYGQSMPRQIDPVMGWTGSADTQSQLRMVFTSEEQAVAYATRNAIPYDLELPVARVRKPSIYSDNFRPDRPLNWTH
ncbi:oxidoreductase [Ameyamaea chiangmaiensis NBRC 103196]|uniref:ETC complex I subunit n=1 Tax=Ameyamaea chiangmaiensis TaxID=442969 RepID=A0A850PEC4_9PROT|nr:ETC complex I subunit [Ameyamaea chiangmaiensis]MBS4075998.1 ETC complex I subunit [Ameyamaea chiangmaiensis]NVN40820.1 ETC complex I subunit [Ameyamaea chiangmaiensis]GBQ61504.1 oxidoreductase [Ameyamaea chiangmaiensis NBRC 103196]